MEKARGIMEGEGGGEREETIATSDHRSPKNGSTTELSAFV